MKKWKKSGRKRKKNKTNIITLCFDLEEYNNINKCRIRYSYSWNKFISKAIKLAIKNEKVCNNE